MKQLVLALVVVGSIILGRLWGDGAEILRPVAQLILGAFKFIVVPMVFSAIALAILRIDSNLKGIVKQTLGLFLLLTCFAALLAYAVVMILPHPKAFSYVTNHPIAALTLQSWAESLLPTNFVGALTGSSLTQVTIVSVLAGLGLRASRHRDFFITLFEGAYDMSMQWMTSINRVLPIFIAVLITWGVGTNWIQLGTSAIIVISTIFVAVTIHIVVSYSILVWVCNRRSLRLFWKHIWPVAATAFATTSAGATLPVTVDAMRKMSISETIIQFVAPTGSIINKGGTAIFHVVGIWTICLVWGIPVNSIFLVQLFLVVVVTSFATGNIPGAGLVGFSMIVPMLGLPIASIAMIAAIDRICDMMRTPTNVIGDCAVALSVQGLNENIRKIKATSI
jgi:Na+/H+-dicarboxylate symporter